ncbi:MAG: ParB/RepB/Spo0J family partition protein [Candidatus Aminicenantales bacterium]
MTRGSVSFEELEVARLVPLPRLLRQSVDDDSIRELALSIKNQGLINPITVRPYGDYYQIVAGFCRWVAHKWLGREKILCKVVDMSDRDSDWVSGIENLHRLALNPVEEALYIKKLHVEDGVSVVEIGDMLSKSSSWVRSRLDVLGWPSNFIDALGDRVLPFSALSELVRVGDEQYRDHLLEVAVSNGVTALVCQGWRLAWEQTQAQMPDDVLKDFRAHVDRPEARIMLVCWGCSSEYVPGDLSYKPLCGACVAKVE